jgi:tRNA 5-methylaminomethyl-2-thiouridine biosynthesis bifunctional protein
LLAAPPEGGGTIIHAHGVSVGDAFAQIPLHGVRGQISVVKADATSNKTNICYGGYISAPFEGWQVVGSTFQKWLAHTDVLDEDHRQIMDNLRAHVPSIAAGAIIGGRAALRTAAKDRFPVIGAAPDGGGALISTAHGSHGIASTLIGAHLIADILRGGVRCLGLSSIAALSPSRFEKRLK